MEGDKPQGQVGYSRRDPETGLTRHQQAFVDGIANNLSFATAYKNAYSCARLRPDEIRRRGYELSQDEMVQAELGRIRERARDKMAYSVADAVNEAELVRQMAMEDRAAAAATGAITLKAKLLGLMTDKIEQTNKVAPPSLPELETQLRDVLRQLGMQAPADLADIAKDNIIPITKRA